MAPRRDIPWRVRWSVDFSPAHRYGVAIFALMVLPPLCMRVAFELGASPLVIALVGAVALGAPATWMVGLWGDR